jgi:hypothetical protein
MTEATAALHCALGGGGGGGGRGSLGDSTCACALMCVRSAIGLSYVLETIQCVFGREMVLISDVYLRLWICAGYSSHPHCVYVRLL